MTHAITRKRAKVVHRPIDPALAPSTRAGLILQFTDSPVELRQWVAFRVAVLARHPATAQGALSADRNGQLTYQPGTPERALMDARINFVLTEMEAPIWLMARHGFVLPKDQRTPGLRPLCEADFARGEAKFAGLLGDGEFFAGGRLTLADIIAGQTLSWARNAKVPLADTSTAYLARMEARPAWQRALGD